MGRGWEGDEIWNGDYLEIWYIQMNDLERMELRAQKTWMHG